MVLLKVIVGPLKTLPNLSPTMDLHDFCFRVPQNRLLRAWRDSALFGDRFGLHVGVLPFIIILVPATCQIDTTPNKS